MRHGGTHNHHRSLGRQFSIIARNLQLITREILSDSDIGSGQFMYLHAVARNENISQQELSELLDVDKATCARAVAKLEKGGYLNRVPDTEDLRYHCLRLTEKGRQMMPRIRQTMRQVTEICGSALSVQEREELLRLLKLVTDSTAAWMDQTRVDK